MPIDQKRVEAAATMLEGFDLFVLESTGQWQEAARALLTAAYPELASDPPTAWLAPWEPSNEMWTITSADPWPAGSWDAMRDAHTKEPR